MRQVGLGQTELKVSAVAFGTWSFGGDWGAADLDESKAAIHRALELGVTFFDTAQGYGFGAAEQLLGDALWQRVRVDEMEELRRFGAAGDPAAAVPPVPADHRGQDPSVHRRARHRRAGVRAAGPRPARRSDDTCHDLQP